MEANIAKLTQCDNTPFYEEPLLKSFNASSLDFSTWEKVLDPLTPIPPNLERGTRLWFRQMQDPTTTIPPQLVTMTEDQYRQSWKKNERIYIISSRVTLWTF